MITFRKGDAKHRWYADFTADNAPPGSPAQITATLDGDDEGNQALLIEVSTCGKPHPAAYAELLSSIESRWNHYVPMTENGVDEFLVIARRN